MRSARTLFFDQPLTIVCRDTPQMGKIRIRKLDEDAQEPCGEGFVFQITVGEDITDGAGNLRVISVDGEEVQLKKGALVDELITDETGTAVSRELYPGSYEVKEIQAGQYYAVGTDTYSVALEPKEETTLR